MSQQAAPEHVQAGIKGLVLAAMVYRSVGVIFGDLGTSPMYIYPSTFDHPPSRSDVMGALSLILWTLTLLALVKYVLIVLWANDDGEGVHPSPSVYVKGGGGGDFSSRRGSDVKAGRWSAECIAT